MIKQRVPKTEKDLRIVEGEFIKSVDKTSLSDLTLDELANRYNEIDYQSHIVKGLILLEARSRFLQITTLGFGYNLSKQFVWTVNLLELV